jgi:ATP-dependent helicase/nuclease subunit B
VKVRLLLGAAGNGKTFRCLEEARQDLATSPEGLPLVLLAPKQTTYQLERQLLAEPSLPGYTRLHILSFERLSRFVLERLGKTVPDMLDEDGRLMVLRGLLAKKRGGLKLFRASARLTGFARQLSLSLNEFQRNQMTPESLLDLAGRVKDSSGLALKLEDLSVLWRQYLDWLKAHGLQDADSLLTSATHSLGDKLFEPFVEHIWVDGFGDWHAQELELLAALAPWCNNVTITFCLDRIPGTKISWLSNWSATSRAFEECKKRLGALPGAEVDVEVLKRHPTKSRFLNNRVLAHLEEHWADPKPYESSGGASRPEESLRIVTCADPEAEVVLAAREVLRHVRAGGRYRDVTVLVRKLEKYHQPLRRIFARYEIPFFMDRRESVSHHPLAELTRSALRAVARSWIGDDWFAALKTGLTPAAEHDIDELENEALARGWQGKAWHQPLRINDPPRSAEDQKRIRQLEQKLESLRRAIIPPFEKLAVGIASHSNRPTGPQLASALRDFWAALDVEATLQSWASGEIGHGHFQLSNAVHTTVWEQMNAWVENVDLGFRDEAISLRDWLPILEAGLTSLSVGVIPPALDQVIIGAVDRSRNPDIKLAIVLGLNETIFPAPPENSALLTDLDRTEIERRGVALSANPHAQISRERYYAYIACTRARERLVLTSAQHDSEGSLLNPSPFLSRVGLLFPELKTELEPAEFDWRKSQHPQELVGPVLKALSPRPQAERSDLGGEIPSLVEAKDSSTAPTSQTVREWSALAQLPALAGIFERLRHYHNPFLNESVSHELAQRLYGPELRTSVSRIEQFAACPFKFFVHSGLRAEERKLFELDSREQGNFQHDVLAIFHQELQRERKRWRDVSPADARARVANIANILMVSFQNGLLQATQKTRFMARILTEALQDFVETLVSWMQTQYQFDPVAVEVPFGEDEAAPAWKIDVSGTAPKMTLALRGRIDRIDLCRGKDGSACCVVVDYKSSQKKLDPLLIANGLQLQLLAYLNVVRRWPDQLRKFGASPLTPVGVFYVNLRGKYKREQNRGSALEDRNLAKRLAYRHSGRFDKRALPQLDARTTANEGDQFNYRLTRNREVNRASREPMETAEFEALLDSVEASLTRMAKEIFSGVASVAPYRKGSQTACDLCEYQAICRIDPWTHHYRTLTWPKNPPTRDSIASGRLPAR